MDNRNEPHVLYLLPKENYIGISYNLKKRLCAHNYNKVNTEGVKILHWFPNKELALQREAEYHARGFRGKGSRGRKL
jgi:predicted GIY-YIG superfamily endonuclease